MTIKTNQIKEIKIASNRFNVNVIIPNQDKNAKCNIYVSSEQGVNDLFIIASAELDARDKAMIPNKKGVIAKNGDLYKSNLKAFDMLFLSERDNRTFLNAIRRLADNPKYSKENCLEMINSDFGKKQNFVNPNTLLNKVDKYFSENDASPENSEKGENSETAKSENDLQSTDFSKVYDSIKDTLQKPNVTVDEVKSIMELTLTIIDAKIKENKIKRAS
tara:strand:+ start:434 stop:1087 length:654 start_codon:yes stop_codon:yes gene_type:complete